jgi:hypothetical protein
MDHASERIAKLSPEKRRLLELLMQKRQSQGEEKINPRQESGVAPLSFAQQRLWFIDQLDPGNFSYNLAGCFELQGPLDNLCLERVISEIITRHETLRTTFSSIGGRPVQVVAPPYNFKLSVIDLSEILAQKQDEVVKKLLWEEAHRSFDLAKDFLLRTYLLRLAEQSHLLVVSMHHIVCDGWSIQILSDEIKILYQVFLRGESSPLAELPVQYADFAAWQQQQLNGEKLEQQLSYWKQRLAGSPDVLELPTDRPRPLISSHRGASKRFALPLPLLKSLRQLSRKERVTMFMTLLAAFKILLFKYSEREDIVVGTSNTDRPRSDIKNLIGCFITVVVLRTDLSGDPSFREVLKRVRDVVLEAFANPDVPFEKLVEVLRPKRDALIPPLFQIMYVYQMVTHKEIDIPNLSMKLLRSETGTSKLDLLLFVRERPEELILTLEYSLDLFEAATIDRKAEHFVSLLKDIVDRPDEPISSLSLIAESHREQLIDDFNCSLI